MRPSQRQRAEGVETSLKGARIGAAVLCSAIAMACTGVIGGSIPASSEGSGGSAGSAGAAGAGLSSGGGGTGGDKEQVPNDCKEPQAGRAPLRRLIRFEYNNTVHDLFKITARPADALPGEELGTGFGNEADSLGVSRLLIDGYRTIAEQIANDQTVDAAHAIATAGCDPAGMGEAACSQRFITDFLGRAFRRPATPEDLTAYQAAFDQARQMGETSRAACGPSLLAHCSLRNSCIGLSSGKPSTLRENSRARQATKWRRAFRICCGARCPIQT